MDKIRFTPAEAITFSAGVRGDRGFPATQDRTFKSAEDMAKKGIGVSHEFIQARWGAEGVTQYTAIMAQRISRSNYAAARRELNARDEYYFADPKTGGRYPGY